MKQVTKGFTLIELLIVIGILAMIAVVMIVALNPAETQRKARDDQRFKDLTVIQGAFEGLIAAGNANLNAVPSASGNGTVDLNNRATVAGGNGSPVVGTGQNCTNNWLGVDVCSTVSRVPIDPVNQQNQKVYMGNGGTTSANAGYRVAVTGSTYDICARLEAKANASKVLNDGGVLPDVYEIFNGDVTGLNCTP